MASCTNSAACAFGDTAGDTQCQSEIEKMCAERGRLTWLSSGEDEGPDCGLILGLGGGKSLHIGEFADETLKDHGASAEDGAGWWIALRGGDGFQFVGPVTNEEAARELLEAVFSSLSEASR